MRVRGGGCVHGEGRVSAVHVHGLRRRKQGPHNANARNPLADTCLPCRNSAQGQASQEAPTPSGLPEETQHNYCEHLLPPKLTGVLCFFPSAGRHVGWVQPGTGMNTAATSSHM